MSEPHSGPNPSLIFDTINAYQRTAAIRTAIELDLFTAIGEGATTPAEIAGRCGVAERGARILCDALVVMGLLEKPGPGYALTADTAVFLDRRSPGYMGGAVGFLLSPTLSQGFSALTDAVRKGGTALDEAGTVAPEHPVWVDFARAMMPLMAFPAQLLTQAVPVDADRPLRILDIAAGHGVFGITYAQRYPQAQVVALDWADVLEVAKENAAAVGVADRYDTIPGSAFEVELGTGYDLVLITNFLHHFDAPTCEAFLRKVHASLAPGGRAATLEFVPNADRVSPPGAAFFSLVMLASTPSGDAYTFPELEAMFRNAGFAASEVHPLGAGMQQVVISRH